jgi:hypothetical protein
MIQDKGAFALFPRAGLAGPEIPPVDASAAVEFRRERRYALR